MISIVATVPGTWNNFASNCHGALLVGRLHTLAMGCTQSVRPDVRDDAAEVSQTRAETSVSRTEGSKTTPVETRFVPLETLKQHGRLPRFGSSPGFVHPVTGEGNENLCRSRDSFDALSTIFIFVSHRWLRLVTIVFCLALALAISPCQ